MLLKCSNNVYSININCMNSKTLIVGIVCFVLYSFFTIPSAIIAQEITPSPQPHTF